MSKRLEAIQIKLVKKIIPNNLTLVDNNGKTVKEYKKDNKYYFFLTNDFDLNNIKIESTENISETSYGNLISNKELIGDFTKVSNISLKLENGTTNDVEIIKSDVPCLNVTLDNDKTLNDVNSGSKETKYPSSLTITGCNDAKYNLSDMAIEFKGRGNTTWLMQKKPYQIKLDKKQNLLGIGKGKAKKWVLLANYMDKTLLKNKIMYDLCVKSGLSNIPNAKHVDLYVNGEYVGNYLLCDKVEIGNDRVNVQNDDGVLVELDNAYYNEEEYNFTSSVSGKHFVIKEFANDLLDAENKTNVMNQFKKSLEIFENKLYNNASWEEVSNLIDVDSFVKYYLLNEFAKNRDTYYSSTYLYKDGTTDVIHMGPIWDYDKDNFSGSTQEDYSNNLNNYMRLLYKYPQFAQKVNAFYEDSLKQNLESVYVEDYANEIKQSSRINSIVWSSEQSYNNDLNNLSNWIEQRKQYYANRYAKSKQTIFYSAHVEDKGWLNAVNDSKTMGTVGEARQMEAIRVHGIDENGDDLSLMVNSHVQDIGWQGWKSNDEMSGTIGKFKRLEAIKIKLIGESENKYDIYYRVHAQNFGWLDWAKNGESAGTSGYSYRLEAIEVKLVEKGGKAPGSTSRPYVQRYIGYKTHVQDYGWQDKKYDGQTSGISGQCKRLEAIQISLSNPLYSGSVQYQTHVQDYGWQSWKADGQTSGTSGQCKRLEAIRIKLTGQMAEKYDIYYRVHAQDYGWLGWAKNGSSAGTEGMSKRLETIEIVLVQKGGSAPGSISNYFYKK